MENTEIRPSIKYKDIGQELNKNNTIQLTMEGDTPGYYSVNGETNAIKENRMQSVKRKRMLIKKNKEKDM